MINQHVRFCRSSDGVKIAYADSGDGPPVFLLPNWLTHLEHQWRSVAWRPWLEALSARYRLIRYDPRECGLSDRNVENLSFDGWVRDFEAVVDAVGIEHFSVIGVCQGGPVAIEFAARNPERVSHLVLYGTYARGRNRRHSAQEAQKAKVMLELMELGWGQEDHAFMRVFATQFQPEGSIEHLRSWCELQRAAASPRNAVRVLRMMFDVDVQLSAARVNCPTLVVHADHDAAAPLEEGLLLAQTIPGAQFLQLCSANHFPLRDEPAWAEMMGAVNTFLPEPTCEAGPFAFLTGREKELLHFIARGLDNHQIGARLDISEKTVRNHVSSIFSKLEVGSRAQAVVIAREAGYGAHQPLH